MADKVSKNTEHREEGPAKKEAPGRPSVAGRKEKEIKETSKGFLEGVSEIVEGTEAAEISEGEVSENVKEGKSTSPSAGFKQGAGNAGEASRKAAEPSIEIMRIQVATQIKQEIRILEKEAAKLLRNPSSFSAFKLNGIIAKIRELKDILSGLAYATVETIKGWWMKFVKRITI
jgi:hypothetical protein